MGLLDYVMFYIFASVAGGGLVFLLLLRAGMGSRRQRTATGESALQQMSLAEFQQLLTWGTVAGALVAAAILTFYLFVWAPREKRRQDEVTRKIEAGESFK